MLVQDRHRRRDSPLESFSSSLPAVLPVAAAVDGFVDAALLGFAVAAFFFPLSLLVFFFLSALLVQPFGALAAAVAFDESLV